MVFTAPEFFLFLPVVLLVYYCLNLRWQNLFLLAASYFFYGWADWRFCTLLFISTVLDFVCGLRIPGRHGKWWLWASVAGQLALLGFFKYFNFFRESFATVLRSVGMDPGWPTLDIILPLGISFYTFQTLSYTIDIWRGKLKPVRSFVDFAVFVSFWPHLVAGPILRASFLLPQITRRREVTPRHWSEGTYFILVGLVKKIAIADVIARICDQAAFRPEQYPTTSLMINMLLVFLRIYCDFSGYSDIARGSSLLLGFRLTENFRYPYISAGIADYWQRWHISLSSWMRDYVYKSFGAGKSGNFRRGVNLMATMFLCGLWHGAAWNFVIWGTMHGVYLVIGAAIGGPVHRLERRAARAGMGMPLRVLQVAATLVITLVTGLLFYLPAEKALHYMRMVVTRPWQYPADYLRVLVYTLCVLMLIDLPEMLSGRRTHLADRPWQLRSLYYAALILLLIFTWTKDYESFMYFQF